MRDRLTDAEMKRLVPTITAKTELVLLGNPPSDVPLGMYERDGKDWVLLTGGAAQESRSPGAAPLSGESPEGGRGQGDDDSDGSRGLDTSVAPESNS